MCNPGGGITPPDSLLSALPGHLLCLHTASQLFRARLVSCISAQSCLTVQTEFSKILPVESKSYYQHPEISNPRSAPGCHIHPKMAYCELFQSAKQNGRGFWRAVDHAFRGGGEHQFFLSTSLSIGSLVQCLWLTHEISYKRPYKAIHRSWEMLWISWCAAVMKPVQVDYITGRVGEEAGDNSLLYQALHFLITKVALTTFSPMHLPKPESEIHLPDKGTLLELILKRLPPEKPRGCTGSKSHIFSPRELTLFFPRYSLPPLEIPRLSHLVL